MIVFARVLQRGILVVAGAILGSTPGMAQSVSQKADAAMHRVFGVNVELQKESIVIDHEVGERIEKRTNQSVGTKAIVHKALMGSTIVGYGIVDDVRGKAQPITYITLFKPDGTIAEIEVLIYREPYGGEIQYETFRKQFRGKHAGSHLHVGDDVQNIAGATISSKAITNGAKKIAVLFDELKKAHKL